MMNHIIKNRETGLYQNLRSSDKTKTCHRSFYNYVSLINCVLVEPFLQFIRDII